MNRKMRDIVQSKVTIAVVSVVVFLLAHNAYLIKENKSLAQVLESYRVILNDVWDKGNHRLMIDAWVGHAQTAETETTIWNDIWDKPNHRIRTSAGGGGGGSGSFADVTGGTNSSAAMVVGTGASITTVGSGIIEATTTEAFAVDPNDCTSPNVARGIDANGACVGSQVDFSELSGVASDAQIPSLNTLSTGLAASKCVETDVNGKLVSASATCNIGGGSSSNWEFLASTQAGADNCVKIQGAIDAAVTAGGGRVVADFTGAYTCTGGFTVKNGVHVTMLPSVVTVGARVNVQDYARLTGHSTSANTGATVIIKAKTNLNDNVLLLQAAVGAAGWWHGGEVSWVRVDGNGSNQSSPTSCVKVTQPGENAVFGNDLITACSSWGLEVTGTVSGSPAFRNLSIFNGLANGSIYLNGTTSSLTFDTVHLGGSVGPALTCKAGSGGMNVLLKGTFQLEGFSVAGAFTNAIVSDNTTSSCGISGDHFSASSISSAGDILQRVNGSGATLSYFSFDTIATGTYTNIYKDVVTGFTIPVAGSQTSGRVTQFNMNAEPAYIGPAIALYPAPLVVANGVNNNVSMRCRTAGNANGASCTHMIVTGPTGVFSITGLAGSPVTNGGVDGQLAIIENRTAFAMTLVNDSASSTAANRINTGTGADYVVGAGSSVRLFYNVPTTSWYLQRETIQGSTDIVGNIPVSNLNSGTNASISTFWRGDGSWSNAGAANGVNAQVGATYTVVAADSGKLVTFSNAGAVAVTLPQATTTGFGIDSNFHFVNLGVGTVTITPTVSTINGASTLVLRTDEGVDIWSTGTVYNAKKSYGVTVGTAGNVVSFGTNGTPSDSGIALSNTALKTPASRQKLLNTYIDGSTCTLTLDGGNNVAVNISDCANFILVNPGANFTLSNPTATGSDPYDNQTFTVRVKSNAARTITLGSKYTQLSGVTMPATTLGDNTNFDRWIFTHVLATDTYDLVAVLPLAAEGGGGGGTGYKPLPVVGVALTSTSPAIDASVNNRELVFDSTLNQCVIWEIDIPGDYTGSPVFSYKYVKESDTTSGNTVRFDVSVMALKTGVAVNTDSYDTAVALTDSTTPGSVDFMDGVSGALTSFDSAVAGDPVKLKMCHNNSDTVGGNIRVVRAGFQYAR